MKPNPGGASRPFHPDDLVVLPDGTWATCEGFDRGDFAWKSDDVERVRLEDVDRLREFNLTEFIAT